MHISELAKQAEVPTSTIRYYERVGILRDPPRTPSGYRDYRGEHVRTLRFVKTAQCLGLRLEEIAEILELRERGEVPCGRVIALLDHHVRELTEHIAVLTAVRIELTRLIRRSKTLMEQEEGVCPIIESERVFGRDGMPAPLSAATSQPKRHRLEPSQASRQGA